MLVTKTIGIIQGELIREIVEKPQMKKKITISIEEVLSGDNIAKVFGEFISLCYALGLNPIPSIRRNFNSYTWTLHEDITSWEALLSVADKSTLVCGFYDESTMETIYITATPKPKTKVDWKKSYWEDYRSDDHGLTYHYRLEGLRGLEFEEIDTL